MIKIGFPFRVPLRVLYRVSIPVLWFSALMIMEQYGDLGFGGIVVAENPNSRRTGMTNHSDRITMVIASCKWLVFRYCLRIEAGCRVQQDGVCLRFIMS